MLSACDTVYVVDPDESVHDALATLLQAAGVRVAGYRTPDAFLNACGTQRGGNCCVLLEADLPGIGSLALIREVYAQAPDMPIIVLASTTDSDIAAQALKAGAIDVIDKPLVGAHLLDRILGVAANAHYATSY
jgi:FixJ family two-component response regulator